mmetsp:Transcript_95715/g.166231  ORF Transcript_95715/g.166231 Transcript_95715/m.166231 type:complete len:153 (-) Transcript_95715:11-469(-)
MQWIHNLVVWLERECEIGQGCPANETLQVLCLAGIVSLLVYLLALIIAEIMDIWEATPLGRFFPEVNIDWIRMTIGMLATFIGGVMAGGITWAVFKAPLSAVAGAYVFGVFAAGMLFIDVTMQKGLKPPKRRPGPPERVARRPMRAVPSAWN